MNANEKLSAMLLRGAVFLELGCGPNRAFPGHLGVDAIAYPAVDVVMDVFEFLGSLPAGCVQEVHSSHFLEHVTDLPKLMKELARVCKPGGRVVSVVPHFSNPYFYSDPTHARFSGSTRCRTSPGIRCSGVQCRITARRRRST